ncbi:MAG: hypothetical protein H6710_10765 [Myxococcales bacterium]|nr:hypothetical protein [Myxococcales bacterium]MCB9702510.1 hypothetical protein [Myxococcales bacterium]
MERAIKTWWSPAVGREMGVARYGHYGKPVIYFPTGGGDYLDCERFLMVRALQPLIDAGRIKLFAVDSVCRQSWTNPEIPPPQKSAAQARYGRYLEDELFPYIRHACGDTDQPMAAVGASIGAYNALNAACRNPERFDLMVGLSGTYLHDHRMGGHFDDDYYYNAPTHFVPNLRGPRLDQLRKVRFVFGLGHDHEHPPYTWAAAHALGRVGVWNWVEQWGPGSGHDWPTWRSMLPRVLGRMV